MEPLLYSIVFLYGIVIGSFLNVLIYRIPRNENFVISRSHCMSCGYQLKWYDLVPVFSYLLLKGKCRKCQKKISIQYPIVEAANGILYLVIFAVNGWQVTSIIYCLLTSLLIVLSVIDFRTYEIPEGINIAIGVLGIVTIAFDIANWLNYVIGFCSVSLFLMLLFLLSKGRAIGGGDIKLMAVSGLVIGWKANILAFFVACLLGSIIHTIRMKLTKEDHVLALGPYLAMGIFIAALWGEGLYEWYFHFMGL